MAAAHRFATGESLSLTTTKIRTVLLLYFYIRGSGMTCPVPGNAVFSVKGVSWCAFVKLRDCYTQVCKKSSQPIITLTAMKHTSTTSPTSTQDPLTTHVTTPPNNSTESVILTVHFTVAGSTSSSNATAGPTSEATAVSESTTPMATELVASTSTAEINNATTETLATTTTTPMETSAQPTETGPSLNSGDYKNWNTAQSLCSLCTNSH